MITQEFLALLLETLAATIPAGTHSGGADREACLAMACTMLEALHPADAKEAAAAARAIAAHFAAMDGFARAARPGIADDTAVRLRNNALAAARLADATTRPTRQAPLPKVEKPSRSAGHAAKLAMPPSQVRHRAEFPATPHGLPDMITQPTRRAGLHAETALSSAQPTVPVPG